MSYCGTAGAHGATAEKWPEATPKRCDRRQRGAVRPETSPAGWSATDGAELLRGAILSVTRLAAFDSAGYRRRCSLYHLINADT